jgi:hypothetical protein
MVETQKKDWSMGLCSCCFDVNDCGFCCLATWCGCIAFGMNSALMKGKRGSDPCCCGWIQCSETCQWDYCGDACTTFFAADAITKYFGMNGVNNGDIGMCVIGCASSLMNMQLIQNQVVVVGRRLKIYEEKLPRVCGCFNEPCCISIWCAPCMLTRVHHELVHDETNVYTPIPGSVLFQNTMFDSVKIK